MKFGDSAGKLSSNHLACASTEDQTVMSKANDFEARDSAFGGLNLTNVKVQKRGDIVKLSMTGPARLFD